jgi:polar amino acid transport system substrate-binding protein
MRSAFLFISVLLFAGGAPLRADEAWTSVEKTGELRWGADVTGGAPFIFPDPENPSRLIGFEVEIMEAVARALNVRHRFVQTQWDQLVPGLLRDDFDVAFNGLEITDERLAVIDFTLPYYYFSEQITVRAGMPAYQNLKELRGKRVGTLSASLAQTLMEEEGGIAIVPYPSPVEAY